MLEFWKQQQYLYQSQEHLRRAASIDAELERDLKKPGVSEEQTKAKKAASAEAHSIATKWNSLATRQNAVIQKVVESDATWNYIGIIIPTDTCAKSKERKKKDEHDIKKNFDQKKLRFFDLEDRWEQKQTEEGKSKAKR